MVLSVILPMFLWALTSLKMGVKDIKLFLNEKYGKDSLTNYQAVQELSLSHGRELASILNTPQLPTLSISHVAQYLHSKTHISLEDKLREKYRNEFIKQDMAYELAITERELEALLSIVTLEVSVTCTLFFLDNFDEMYGKLTKRKYLKMLYWEHKLTTYEIANLLGVNRGSIEWLITKHGLRKKAYNVPTKGRLGYTMPKEEKEKHIKQSHTKAIVQKTISGDIVQYFPSINSTTFQGFHRGRVRNAIRNKVSYKGYNWELFKKE